jgi:hypothetical protein
MRQRTRKRTRRGGGLPLKKDLPATKANVILKTAEPAGHTANAKDCDYHGIQKESPIEGLPVIPNILSQTE